MVKLPRLPALPGLRKPKGWNLTEITLHTRSNPALGSTSQVSLEPAGDPPAGWPGTRPEWAIYWGLSANGLKEGADFIYQANTPGVETSYYSTLDFQIPAFNLGIEVQGEFWHYAQGTQKIQSDELRRAYFAGLGIIVIFIDENDALRDPKFYASEALHYRDHSQEGQ